MTRRDMAALPLLLGSAGRLPAQVRPPGRLRPGLVAYSYRAQLERKTLTYEELIRRVADFGLEGLDTTVYWFPDTTGPYLAMLRRTAHKNGVSLYSIATRVRLCQSTPELRLAQVDAAKKWVDVADRLGATHVRVFGGAVPPGVSADQAIAWAAETLKAASDYSASRGILLGVEDDGGLTTDAEPTIAIVKRADSP